MRKQILLRALTAFGFMLGLQVSAQQQQSFRCGNPEQMKKLYAQNPQLALDHQKMIDKYKENRIINGKSTTVYVVPIVFHIVHEYGSENLTDAQVYDQMDILNEDYRKLNADTADIVPAFDTLAGDARIEFRLATIDPYGNCTNGIEHIYSHQTNAGDDYSKINQWHRSEYLNVWVTRSIGEAGVAGYAYYPASTEGGFFFADGIIILHDYIGSIGTGTPFRSRALTHEIGHYLGLAHTWGNTNDPEVACGDDQVDDTPETAGHTSCDLTSDNCNAGIIENVQNYMEYSYCSNMFTKDQIGFMRNNLTSETAQRNNLWADSNLVLTGTNVLTAPTCIPVADFSVDKKTICTGDNVTFKDATWRAGGVTLAWSFPGGTPATSTASNPVVTYDNPGFYDATLVATSSAGSDTLIIPNAVYVSSGAAEIYGPAMQDFNQNPIFWISQNPEDNHASFQRIATGGKDNSACYKLNNYKNVASAQAYTEDWYYYNRLGNSKDYLISPAYNLSNTSNVTVSFDYSYGTKATDLAGITEKLIVYSSRDCGKTWVVRTTIDAEDIITAGYVGSTDFAPANNSQWKTATFNYTSNATDTKTRFRFEFIASDNSSNFYIDNVNVGGVLAIEENGLTASVSVSPNPVAAGSEISVEISDNTAGMEIQVVDINGALISVTKVDATNGTATVNVPMNVAKGLYFLNAVQGNTKSTHRVVVY